MRLWTLHLLPFLRAGLQFQPFQNAMLNCMGTPLVRTTMLPAAILVLEKEGGCYTFIKQVMKMGPWYGEWLAKTCWYVQAVVKLHEPRCFLESSAIEELSTTLKDVLEKDSVKEAVLSLNAKCKNTRDSLGHLPKCTGWNFVFRALYFISCFLKWDSTLQTTHSQCRAAH